MLAYIIADGRGQADRLLAQVCQTLIRQGVALAGAVQHNVEDAPDRPCHMDLSVLPDGGVIRISQSLGPHATGCRLDTDGLERAAGRVAAMLDTQPALLVVNKFGRQEAEGRGFRPVIAQAIGDGIPVLTAVAADHLAAFTAFASDHATLLPATEIALLEWCGARRTQVA